VQGLEEEEARPQAWIPRLIKPSLIANASMKKSWQLIRLRRKPDLQLKEEANHPRQRFQELEPKAKERDLACLQVSLAWIRPQQMAKGCASVSTWERAPCVQKELSARMGGTFAANQGATRHTAWRTIRRKGGSQRQVSLNLRLLQMTVAFL